MIPQDTIEFDLSSQCTRRCSFCDPGIPRHRRADMVALEVGRHRRVIEELAASGWGTPGHWLVYCGHGEPLMHPGLLGLVKSARDAMPEVGLCVFTNGDLLTTAICDGLQDVGSWLVWDNYGHDGADDETSRRVPGVIRASKLHPSLVRVSDHVRPRHYISRCGTVFEGEPRTGQPCEFPRHRLFLSSEGNWLLCCSDYHQTQSWPGSMTCDELNAAPDFAKLRDGLLYGHRDSCETCAVCDHPGKHIVGFEPICQLQRSRLWSQS